jgi:hypothetical protein
MTKAEFLEIIKDAPMTSEINVAFCEDIERKDVFISAAPITGELEITIFARFIEED